MKRIRTSSNAATYLHPQAPSPEQGVRLPFPRISGVADKMNKCTIGSKDEQCEIPVLLMVNFVASYCSSPLPADDEDWWPPYSSLM